MLRTNAQRSRSGIVSSQATWTKYHLELLITCFNSATCFNHLYTLTCCVDVYAEKTE
ncbi:hypothetical protein PYR75_01485 [Acinetobacter soli]|nr:hypothetical protein PYR75_01485 [Acinetobacter soli]